MRVLLYRKSEERRLVVRLRRKPGVRRRARVRPDMLLEGNDREVIEACRRGERDAFRALFETYQDRVYSIALRYSGDRSLALDIAQEVFLKLLSNIQEFRGDAGFEAWLYRVVVNCCLDRQRRGRMLLFVEDFFDSLRGADNTVLQDMMRQEMQQHVQGAVAKLSPEHRMVVVLRYTEGLSYDQIAEALGCSAGTVASRLNRAHKILERRLRGIKHA
jgi:RNA polymerase sigma-70 factor (ECF subfamily)